MQNTPSFFIEGTAHRSDVYYPFIDQENNLIFANGQYLVGERLENIVLRYTPKDAEHLVLGTVYNAVTGENAAHLFQEVIERYNAYGFKETN